jgi:hypothetical protein
MHGMGIMLAPRSSFFIGSVGEGAGADATKITVLMANAVVKKILHKCIISPRC